MAQVHVLTNPERRRRFSLEQKRAIVAAAFAPGAVVSNVARQADVCSSLIYRWRREIGPPRGFAEVIMAPMVEGGERRGLSSLPRVEATRPAVVDAAVARRSKSSCPAPHGCGFPRRSRRTWRRR